MSAYFSTLELRLDIHVSGTVAIGLVDRRSQIGKSKQLGGAGETLNITNIIKYHSAVDVTDTQNGYDDRVIEFHDLCHFSLDTV